MGKILIQFAHPVFSKSRVHRALVASCRNIPGITFNDLYELYPDLYIDVKREQELLLKHDIIIFQFPFYWYSSPPILKQWFDLVLDYNWAYGPQGFSLTGKKWLCVLSCGGAKDAYKSSGYNRYPVNQFLLPFKQTAELCRMEYLPPFVVYGTHRISPTELKNCTDHYAELLHLLVKENLTPGQYQHEEHINHIFLSDKTRSS